MPIFRLFRLPVRRRPHPPPVDPATVAQALVESAHLATDALLARLGSGSEGLTNHEAAPCYRATGANSLADAERNGPWRRLLPILASPLSLLPRLALAAILAGHLTLTQLVKAWAVRRFDLA